MRRFRFTIGGLMGAVAWGALASAVLVAVVRPEPEPVGGRQATLLLPPLGLVVVVDTVRLIRRCWASVTPEGSAWSLRAFLGGMAGVWACLSLPFAVLADGELARLLWLPVAPIMAGLALVWPVHWIGPHRNAIDWPLILVASTMILLASTRLVARGWIASACALALLNAGLSAALLLALINS